MAMMLPALIKKFLGLQGLRRGFRERFREQVLGRPAQGGGFPENTLAVGKPVSFHTQFA